MKISELKNERKNLLAAADELVKEHGEDISDETLGQVDELMAQADEASAKIEAAEARRKTAIDTANRVSAANAAVTAEPVTAAPSAIAGVSVGVTRELEDKTRGFADLGAFAASVMESGTGHSFDERLDFCAANNQTIGSQGGFLVPPEFSQEIISGLYGASDSLIARTTNLNITGDSITFPADAEISRVNGSRHGGVAGYWKSELPIAAMTESNPTLREVKLEPECLTVFVKVTDKLLMNGGPAVGQWINGAAQDEVNFKVGDAIVNGNGVGQPLGFLQSGALISVAKDGSQTAATLSASNVDRMHLRLPANLRAGAIWLHNQDAEGEIANLEDGNGNALMRRNFMLDGSMVNSLYGIPLVPCEYMPTLGSAGDLTLCSLQSYITATRGGTRSDSSIHLNFDKLTTAFRFLLEIDGSPKNLVPTTPYQGSSTVSPFVTTAVRA